MFHRLFGESPTWVVWTRILAIVFAKTNVVMFDNIRLIPQATMMARIATFMGYRLCFAVTWMSDENRHAAAKRRAEATGEKPEEATMSLAEFQESAANDPNEREYKNLLAFLSTTGFPVYMIEGDGKDKEALASKIGRMIETEREVMWASRIRKPKAAPAQPIAIG